MSIPSGAVYNRCRPVPPWNGSSSASQPRRATTRCSRGYRGKREAGSGKRGPRRGIILAAAILFVPALLVAQQTTATQTHPEVVNLTLKGVKSVKQSDL